jgi:CheY-like chemotaxis protein
VLGDPARLQQVVLNLLTNAIKFTPAGGRVRVAVERAGRRATIRVSDTGSGIERDFLPHVFTTFAQADPTRTRLHGGLGLGLAIAHHLVEAHGGTIEAESAGKGRGATFSVSLPLLRRRPQKVIVPQREPRAVSPRRELRAVRILVVEDDPGTREALAEMLSHNGAEVRATGSAAQAMAAFAELAPQVLVIDLAMPGEDGVSLLQRIRALGPERHGDVPAVALTALAGEEDRRRALAAGFQLYLVKPLGIERLVDALVSLLPAVGDAHSIA